MRKVAFTLLIAIVGFTAATAITHAHGQYKIARYLGTSIVKRTVKSKPQKSARLITEIAPTRFRGFVTSPVTISAVTVADQPISFGKEFSAADGFLKDLKIELTNTSDKIVTYVSINLQLQTGNTALPQESKKLIVPYSFGDKSWMKRRPETDPASFLKPGQSVTVRLLDGRPMGADPMEAARQSFQPKGYQFEIGVDIVMIEGDVMWRMGYLHNRTGPELFTPIKPSGQTSRALPDGVTMLNATYKPNVIQDCPFKITGVYNYVSCIDMYGGTDCVYQVADTGYGDFYSYSGSYRVQCFHLWGGGACFPEDYYVPNYAYCGV